MDSEQKKVLDRLEAQCSKREYCVSDVRTKAFKALDGDSNRAAEVVDSLVKDKFVDDARYAGAFAREKSALTGWGVVKIRYALRAKGIAPETIAEALEDIDAGKAADKLEKLMAAKRKSLEGDPQIKLKLIKYALTRGYEYDEIQEYL
ncbi:MAG: RecX family transcriptional regulator [Bacteroidales bacterium]|nr:RecX family transcriptional regulator [Bacteroidales bacterium]